MSAKNNFEKTRIQDPDRAHEEANMLLVGILSPFGEFRPTVQDLETALAGLEELQVEASRESLAIDKMTRPLKTALAGFVEGREAALELLALALVTAGSAFGMYPDKHLEEKDRRIIMENLKKTKTKYEMHRYNLSSAHEQLEIWRRDAEEYANQCLK